MRTADPDLHETFAPLREVEPTPEDIARVLAKADELRSPRSLAAPRRRAGRAVALVAATAAVIGAIAALPGGDDSSRPSDAHGVFQAAAAVAAEQPAPAGLPLHARARPLRLRGQRRRRRARPRHRGAELGELDVRRLEGAHHRPRPGPPRGRRRRARRSWRRRATSARSSSRTTATTATATARWRACPSPRYRATPPSAGALLEAAIRDGRWMPDRNAHPHWAPGVVETEVGRSAVLLLAMGNLDGGQRQALFGLLGTRPGARSLGEVTDATGRKGVGVALRLPDLGAELRVIIDPETSDILQSSEVMTPPPAQPAEGARGRAQAPALASAGVAGRAHPGLPEHGQRRGARGAAVALEFAVARCAAAEVDSEPEASADSPPELVACASRRRRAASAYEDRGGSGGVASKRRTPPETTARAPSPTSSAPASPRARMSSSRPGRGRTGRRWRPRPAGARRAARARAAARARSSRARCGRARPARCRRRRRAPRPPRAAARRCARRWPPRAGRRPRSAAERPVAHAPARVALGRRWWRPRARPGRGRGTRPPSPRA